MDDDFETPFPFCEACATWHEPGKHMPTWHRRDRFTFWYGWTWGAGIGIAFALVVHLIWGRN